MVLESSGNNKNQLLSTRVVCTRCNQNGELHTTVNIYKTLIDFDLTKDNSCIALIKKKGLSNEVFTFTE